jgi:hypothetical protein
VPVLDPLSLFAVSSSSFGMTGPVNLLAYGSLPGMELIPYFLALVAWVFMAISAIFLSPFTALIRRIRRTRGTPAAEAKSEPTNPPNPQPEGKDITT